jgi:divalent metal cation (Fe/Co/Zn/Cd) transporter
MRLARMVYKAIMSIADHKISKIGYPVLAVAAVAIILKEFSFVITKRAAVRLTSR